MIIVGVLVIVVALGVTGVAVTGGPETAQIAFGNFAVTSSVGVLFLLGMVTAAVLLLGLWCIASGLTRAQIRGDELDDLRRRAAGDDDLEPVPVDYDEPVPETTPRDERDRKRRGSRVVGATARVEVPAGNDHGRDSIGRNADQEPSLTLPRQTVRHQQTTAEPYIQDQDPDFVPESSVSATGTAPAAETGGIDPVDSGSRHRTTVPEQPTATSADPEGEYSKG